MITRATMNGCPLRLEKELEMKPSASERDERHKESDRERGSLKRYRAAVADSSKDSILGVQTFSLCLGDVRSSQKSPNPLWGRSIALIVGEDEL
jgi:hypothetical protein